MACSPEQARKNGKNGGRPILFANRLQKILIAKIEKNAEKIADKLLEKGLQGDLVALKELLDRGLGKAQANVDVTSKGEKLAIEISEVIAKKNGLQ